MISANLKFHVGDVTSNANKVFQCHPGGVIEAIVIFSLSALGMGVNIILMTLILAKRQLRRWSQGLLFHQAMVDCARAAILLPLGSSILHCQPVNKCSLVETAFLLLVTVSTVNMLMTVLNESPVLLESDEEADLTAPLLMDSPQCVLFGISMNWFSSITINLGPTFLSGTLAANIESGHIAPSCLLVHGPFRHYILNALWIVVNIIYVGLTFFHLRRLHRDLKKVNAIEVRRADLVATLVNMTEGHQGALNALTTEDGDMRNGTTSKRMGAIEEGLQRVKMFLVITAAYVLFWGPLFFVTLVYHPVIGNPISYEVTLHIAYVHTFVNPALYLVLHQRLRQGMKDVCCGCYQIIARWILESTPSAASYPMQNVQLPRYEPPIPSPSDPSLAGSATSPDDSIVIPPYPWSLTSRPMSISSLYEEEQSRRPSLLLPPPIELNYLQMNPMSSNSPSE